ncbi:coiled-coil domain-containing protein 82 isoform X2 [Amblyraja radiata]|uniref:coiled-coil domain-containing protein 82 isoform X2 n=1 Tax=Amblyraja radiata TaxID=386614 RepID=UPI001402488D|nr:coiled-coil domain-containing protein 82 isoform X2 [Amblyraja radiata]
MAATISKYRTRARTNTSEGFSKSRIDRKRTRMDSVSQMYDADEDEESSSEKSENEESMSSTSEDEEEQNPLNKATDSSDEEPVIQKKRLRFDPFIESESSSDSEICSKPIRKIKCNSRHICVQDEEEGSGEETTTNTNLHVKIEEGPQLEKELTIARKRKRQLELKRLSQRRRTQISTRSSFQLIENSDEESEATSFSQEENSSGTEWENDSLKDFIVSDEEDLYTTSNHSELSPSFLAKHLPNFLIRDLHSHFQSVVKALLINAFDVAFLKSLYGSREKKYAKEMLNSLKHVDERHIQMRLTNLRTTSRWRDRYKERVDCYPDLCVKGHQPIETSCQACELKRTCRFTVILSGQLYDSKSLEQDSFMSNDKQVMSIGRVCAERTKVYHRLKHFKYWLYQECCSMVQSEDIRDEDVKDAVNRIYKRLEEQNWIEEQYKHLETILNDADKFCEEKHYD